MKPFDCGAEGVTGSIDACGRWIAVNGYHPQHGYVTLTTADPFPEGQRYNPAAVRRYRAGLAALDGFGPQNASPVAARLLDDAIPQVDLDWADGTHGTVTTWAAGGGVFQRWTLDSALPWRGRLSLQRCAYTQLTEGGPVPMPPTETHARFEAGILTITNPALPWAVALAGFPAGDTWEQRTTGPLELDIPGQAGTFEIAAAFGPTDAAVRDAVQRLARDPSARLDAVRAAWQTRFDGVPPDPLIRRGLSYGLMLAVPVGETRCILTDHMLLPLSWNRDAYYVARALLSWWPDQSDIVRRHLLWLFDTAERPDGAWGRCYLANGRIKDGAFQLDQQLWPLLELAEYVQETGDRATWERLRPAVRPLLDMLLERKAPDVWLFPTDETPADDPVSLPYHLSSHILLWHTLRALENLTDDIPPEEPVRRAVIEHFTAAHDGRTLYAYATDGQGRFQFYHDANDIPLVLAPVWGFTPADDPVWRATVDFAFSPANKGGWYAGRLGSVHTRAPWPLGDVQDWITAHLLDDPARARRAWDHLHTAAQRDGALPEAADGETVVSRHWFAWPNAALAWAAHLYPLD